MRFIIFFAVPFCILIPVSQSFGESHDYCDRYAKQAIAQYYEARQLGLKIPFPVWSDNYNHHYDWCCTQSIQPIEKGYADRQSQIDAYKENMSPKTNNTIGTAISNSSGPENHTSPITTKPAPLGPMKTQSAKPPLTNDELLKLFLTLNINDPNNASQIHTDVHSVFAELVEDIVKSHEQELTEQQQAQDFANFISVWGEANKYVIKIICGDLDPNQCSAMLKDGCRRQPSKACIEENFRKNLASRLRKFCGRNPLQVCLEQIQMDNYEKFLNTPSKSLHPGITRLPK